MQTQEEIEDISQNQAKTITSLDVMEFLKMIKEKAEQWKKDLTNG